MGAAPGPRLVDAMPRPLLVVFALAAAAGIGIVIWLLVRPPSFETVSLEQRRPPPRGTFSHDVGRVFSLPPPSPLPAYEPPCPAVATARPLGGVPGVGRLRAVLEQVCTLAGGGVPPEVGQAVAGLRDVTIQFAEFRRSGVESTVDFGVRRIWLNVKFSARDMPVREVVPVLLHDAWHLAHADEAVTAAQELLARTVELETCRNLISIDDWPRWCTDAQALVGLGRARAIEALVAAGFAA